MFCMQTVPNVLTLTSERAESVLAADPSLRVVGVSKVPLSNDLQQDIRCVKEGASVLGHASILTMSINHRTGLVVQSLEQLVRQNPLSAD